MRRVNLMVVLIIFSTTLLAQELLYKASVLEGEFKQVGGSIETYSLDIGDNTVHEGALVISGTTSVEIILDPTIESQGTGSGLTVLMKVSEVDVSKKGQFMSLAIPNGTSYYYLMGLKIKSGTAEGMMFPTWGSSEWSNSNAANIGNYPIDGSTNILGYTYKYDGSGSAFYLNGNHIHTNSYLRNGNNIVRISLGGIGSTFLNEGMKIHEIRIYSTQLQNDAVALTSQIMHNETLSEAESLLEITSFGNYVGGYSSTHYDDLKTLFNNGNCEDKESLASAITLFKDSRVPFIDGGYYRICNAAQEEKYLSAYRGDQEEIELVESSLFDAGQIWRISSFNNGDNRYQIGAQGLFMGPLAADQAITCQDDSGAGEFTLYEYSPGLWQIGHNSLYLALTDEDQRSPISGNFDEDTSVWRFYPATAINVTVSAANYATIHFPFSVEIPAGLTLFSAHTPTATELTLSPFKGSILSAETPMVIKGESAIYSFSLSTDEGTQPSHNILEGTLSAAASSADTYYALGNLEGTIGFYLSSVTTIPANKAYLPLSALTSQVKGFVLLEEGATTVADTNVKVHGQKQYYDLSGRKVISPRKGLYLSAGKLILMK